MLHLAGGEASEVDSEVVILEDMNEESSMNFLRFVGWNILFLGSMNLCRCVRYWVSKKYLRSLNCYCGGAISPTFQSFKFLNRRGFNTEFGTEFEQI